VKEGACFQVRKINITKHGIRSQILWGFAKVQRRCAKQTNFIYCNVMTETIEQKYRAAYKLLLDVRAQLEQLETGFKMKFSPTVHRK
jgi:hypothetical protein